MDANIIKRLNSQLVKNIAEDTPKGLFKGTCGIAFYFYKLYDYTGDRNHLETADSILKTLLNQGLPDNCGVSVSKGLSGIGLCFDFILAKGYVKGNENVLLKDIDGQLFKKLCYDDNTNLTAAQLSLILFYLCRRVRIQTKDGEAFIYKEFAYKVLNQIVESIDYDTYEEPLYFSVFNYDIPVVIRYLSIFYKSCDVRYRDRTLKVLDNIFNNVRSRLPRLNIDRLFLYWSLIPLFGISGQWNEYVSLLRKNIDVDVILTHELSNLDVYMDNGVSFLYFILHQLEQESAENVISFDVSIIRNKLISSDAWLRLINSPAYFMSHSGLVNGFPGVVLALYEMKTFN